jgi:hypothetical protein
MSVEQRTPAGLDEADCKDSHRGWFWPALIVTLACLAASLIALFPRQELYRGKRFSYWLDQLPSSKPTAYGGVVSWLAYSTPIWNQAELDVRRQRADEAAKIVRRVGAKHLPMLVHRLRSKDFPWKMAVLNWAVRFHLVKPAWVHPADVRSGQALTAIIELGYAAKPIFPELRALTKDRDPQVRESARYALDRLRPEEFERLEKMQSARKVR